MRAGKVPFPRRVPEASSPHPLLRGQEEASHCLLGGLTFSQPISKGGLCPTANLLLCFWGLGNGPKALGYHLDAGNRYACLPWWVFFLCPRVLQLISFYPLGYQVWKGSSSSCQSLSPHLHLAAGCLRSSEQFLFKANILLKLNIYTENCPNQKITNG